MGKLRCRAVLWSASRNTKLLPPIRLLYLSALRERKVLHTCPGKQDMDRSHTWRIERWTVKLPRKKHQGHVVGRLEPFQWGMGDRHGWSSGLQWTQHTSQQQIQNLGQSWKLQTHSFQLVTRVEGTAPWLQTILLRHSNQNNMVLAQNRHTDQ